MIFLQCMRQHWLDFIYTNIKWRRKKGFVFGYMLGNDNDYQFVSGYLEELIWMAN